jgi:hypothetical protein
MPLMALVGVELRGERCFVGKAIGCLAKIMSLFVRIMSVVVRIMSLVVVRKTAVVLALGDFAE